MKEYTRAEKDIIIGVLTDAKTRLATKHGEGQNGRKPFLKWLSVAEAISGFRGGWHLADEYINSLHEGLGEIGWLYKNCEEFRNDRTPWSVETCNKVQAWRHGWIDNMIRELSDE
jgi:hypothetical protein